MQLVLLLLLLQLLHVSCATTGTVKLQDGPLCWRCTCADRFAWCWQGATLPERTWRRCTTCARSCSNRACFMRVSCSTFTRLAWVTGRSSGLAACVADRRCEALCLCRLLSRAV